MNYYPHHIGDFNSATRHLTRVERSIYRDLMELYYDSEKPISKDLKGVCRKIIARTEEEATAVEQVLNEFFTETDQGWVNDRCEREILKYREYIEAKSNAGKASAAKRSGKSGFTQHNVNDGPTDVQQPFNGCSTNHTHKTVNQEPLNQDKKHTPLEPTEPKNPVCDFTTTLAGICCKAIIQQGIKSTNQYNPLFIALLEAGATEQEFANAAKTAVSKGKPDFAYAIGIVKKQREDAAKLLLHRGRMPTKQESVELENKEATKRAKARLFGLQTEKDITNEATRL